MSFLRGVHFALFTEFFEFYPWAVLRKVLLFVFVFFFPPSKATRRHVIVLNFSPYFLDTFLLLLVVILMGLLLLSFILWYLPVRFLFILVVELKTYTDIKVKNGTLKNRSNHLIAHTQL